MNPCKERPFPGCDEKTREVAAQVTFKDCRWSLEKEKRQILP
jgi:hypothetical protein